MSFYTKLLYAGITKDSEDPYSRKIFITNAMAIFLSLLVLFLVIFLDILFLSDYSAALRRVLVTLVLLSIPLCNHYQKAQLAKAIMLLVPSFILFFVPILMNDVAENQFLWFHYLSALFCCVPFLVYDQVKERLQIALFFLYYLFITLFIDQGLELVFPIPDYLANLTQNFARYKVPPLFIAFFSTGIIIWYNRINSLYESRLQVTNAQLLETQEELMTKNDQFEAINKDLERLVEERARTIESKNNQIIDYANINAHKVRAPLARILGLINISMYELDEEELKFVLNNIEDSARELDVILRQIAETLSEKDRYDS